MTNTPLPPKVTRRRHYTTKEKVLRWLNSQVRKIKQLKRKRKK